MNLFKHLIHLIIHLFFIGTIDFVKLIILIVIKTLKDWLLFN
jgi:hypothetical protein